MSGAAAAGSHCRVARCGCRLQPSKSAAGCAHTKEMSLPAQNSPRWGFHSYFALALCVRLVNDVVINTVVNTTINMEILICL